ncbi:MAG: efflux RND transporter periplasmic adaptor subunit [Dysgonomonas sp.]
MNLKKIVFGALALMVITLSCSKSAEKKDDAPQELATTVLSEQNVQLETVYPATIKGQEDIEIRPRIDGFIEAIYVDEGSVVRKGQSLFKINSPSSEQGYTTALAAVNSADAQVKTAQLNVDRIAPLAKDGIVSVTQLKTYENALETAKASLKQANAQLKNATDTRSWTNVTSPVDGVVGSIPYRQGSLVNSTNALTTVSSTKNVFVYFSINEKELVSLLDGLQGKTQTEKINNLPEVTLKMADGNIYSEKGKIKTITGQVNVNTGTVNLRADFPNAEGLLRSGFSGNIIIPRHIDNAIIIPQSLTKTQQDKYLAFKVQGDTMAVQTLISIIPTPDGKNYVVTSGLNAGDRVVSEGLVTMVDGTKIKVKK